MRYNKKNLHDLFSYSKPVIRLTGKNNFILDSLVSRKKTRCQVQQRQQLNRTGRMLYITSKNSSEFLPEMVIYRPENEI